MVGKSGYNVVWSDSDRGGPNSVSCANLNGALHFAFAKFQEDCAEVRLVNIDGTPVVSDEVLRAMWRFHTGRGSQA
jgi:hypothetical protein